MLQSLKRLPFITFSTIPLETDQDLENLKQEVKNLPQNHPLEKCFEFDKLGALYFKNIQNPIGAQEFLVVSKPVAFKLMEKLYVDPANAFLGKRGMMYYFKTHGIYIKVRWIEEFLQDNVLHQMKSRKKSTNFIVRPIIATGAFEHWQIDLIDFSNLKDKKANFIAVQVNPENVENVDQEEDLVSREALVSRSARYILVAIDIFSKFCHLEAIPSKTPLDVWQGMERILRHSQHLPKILQHDKGNEFKGEFAANLAKFYPQIQSIFSLAYKPQSQGHVERLNKTIKEYLKQHYFLTGTTDFVQVLPSVEYKINNTYQETIETAPEYIHIKLPPEIRLPNSYAQFQKDFVTSTQFKSERAIPKKYYGDWNALSPEQKQELPKERLDLIAKANWLILKRANEKLTKFERYQKLVDPFLNRDLIANPLFVIVSIDSLKQRTKDKDKVSKASKSLLKMQWSKAPTRVTRIWFDDLKNPRIVTEAFPEHAFYPHEVIVVKKFENQKNQYSQIWQKNLTSNYLFPSERNSKWSALAAQKLV